MLRPTRVSNRIDKNNYLQAASHAGRCSCSAPARIPASRYLPSPTSIRLTTDTPRPLIPKTSRAFPVVWGQMEGHAIRNARPKESVPTLRPVYPTFRSVSARSKKLLQQFPLSLVELHHPHRSQTACYLSSSCLPFPERLINPVLESRSPSHGSNSRWLHSRRSRCLSCFTLHPAHADSKSPLSCTFVSPQIRLVRLS